MSPSPQPFRFEIIQSINKVAKTSALLKNLSRDEFFDPYFREVSKFFDEVFFHSQTLANFL